MPRTEDGGFLLDDSGLSPYSVEDESEDEGKKDKKDKKNNE